MSIIGEEGGKADFSCYTDSLPNKPSIYYKAISPTYAMCGQLKGLILITHSPNRSETNLCRTI